MFDSSIPPRIQLLLTDRGVIRAERIASGFSGASVYRCSGVDHSDWALKQWPEHTAAERVEQVHRVLGHARQAGCEIVPLPISWSQSPEQTARGQAFQPLGQASADTRQTVAGRHWELMPWLAGEPLMRDASLERIRLGANAISEFHRAIAGLGEQRQPAPAVIRRLTRLEQLQGIIPRLAPETVCNCGPIPSSLLQAGCQLLQQEWFPVQRQLVQALKSHLSQPVRVQFVLRDVHREHLLFCGDQVSGLIDFDAIRLDTPLTDFARWAFDFVLDHQNPEAVWESVMGGYLDGCPISDQAVNSMDARLTRDLCRATLWISLANWLSWIVIERRRFPVEPKKIVDRLQLLIRGAANQVI